MRRLLWVFLGLGVAALLGTGATLRWVWSSLHVPYSGWSGSEVVADLPRDFDAGSMLDRLGRAGVIRHPRLARAWVVFQGWDRDLKAGEYRFERAASIIEVVDRLRRGEVLLHVVTVPEGLALDEVAGKVAEAGFGAADALLAAFHDPAPIREVDPAAVDLEGYLFPDTYALPRGEEPSAIARAMVRRFNEVTGPDYPERARAVGLTPRQAVILASLIERETGLAEERPRVSRVFHNRLKRDMLLQCDPTVLYALRRAGRGRERLFQTDLVFPSAWNTYVSKGLPPGPICNPGRESLLAAVSPAAGDDLYFVAAPEGGHRFSKDLLSHQRAVREWHLYERSSR